MKNRKKIIFIFSLIFIAVILNIITFSKNFVENFYSRRIYKFISGNIGNLTSLLNFSLGEILLIIFILLIMIYIILLIRKILFSKKTLKDKFKIFGKFIYNIICLTLIIYIVFLIVWGLNYHRVPLIENYSAYNDKPITNDDIYLLAENIIKDINNLKNEMKYIKTVTNYQALNRMVESEYDKVFEEFDFLSMSYSKTKPIMMSKLFLYLQITGIYSPFTSEANVNILIPNISIPFTIAHEMAHKIGIAYEDEANFIAYVACSKHSDAFIRYSASFEALLYVLGEVKRDENYSHLMSNLNAETKEEIKKYYEFWQQYTGNLAKVSQKVNDTYLKANKQEYGVKSYSRVVRLLVLYNRSKNITF